MNICLSPNLRKDPLLEVTGTAFALLKKMGVRVLLPQEAQAAELLVGAEYLPVEEAFAQADAVLTIGGDGTMLHAARHCLQFDKPMLGVNVGRLGFLATCEPDELAGKLKLLVEGQYCCDARRLLQAQVLGGEWQGTALNDIVLYSGSHLQAIEFLVECDGSPVSHFNSDGVIVATPTGSTAYSLSAGGPILDAHIAGFVVNAICAHSLKTPPIVFSADRKITLQPVFREKDEVFICCDGSREYPLTPQDVVQVELSARQLKLISFGPAEQFEAIDKKLKGRW